MPPPKRNIKSNIVKPKSLPPVIAQEESQQNLQPTDAELKFDQEVLWCISQFEKLLSSGKIPESKREYVYYLKIISKKRLKNTNFPQKLRA